VAHWQGALKQKGIKQGLHVFGYIINVSKQIKKIISRESMLPDTAESIVFPFPV
jgi:hypothetical protein